MNEKPMMQPQKITLQIKEEALNILSQYPDGLRFSILHKKIQEANPLFKPNTISGCIWNLEVVYPEKVYKPSKGLFRLTTFKEQEAVDQPGIDLPPVLQKIKEANFYAPFADWLQNEIEDVTRAISLGGNVFKDKWGTPDVLGKKESKRSDVIKGPIEIVSAEIKTDTYQLITAFGQVCAYKLFSHKTYLVIPKQSHDEEISRLDSLCQIFGIGLVTFDVTKPEAPDFRILVRPSKHEPDLFYTNKYMALIEAQLF